ncbi:MULTISPECIES: cell division protein ZapA [Fictibacillus]|uniref:Cell division protein ZapA n=1 Tax=Fictibacillus terranigra TaxID=3058424 RepID=A0ABT8E430_9BACL|nr:cell division protein ZapA [Fictibacillus sp. CENA-BCM004]MDN4072665.1 cell division protein ZapA [Fictibacillus sp. CENA-BCM004]
MIGGNFVAEDKMKARTIVEIFGQKYTVIGTEASSHIRSVAAMVDEKMRDIQQYNAVLDTKQLAVLTAVNLMNEYLKTKEELEKLQQQIRKEDK